MPVPPRLADVIAVLDERYDPRWAESWDAVGLVCGDPAAEVRRVLLAVDPVAAVAREATDWRADLLVTHHPLFLRPVHGVPATTPKGRLVDGLIRAGVALHVVHTNADNASPGVSDALAAALGLGDLRPLEPRPAEPDDKLVVFVPTVDAPRLFDALSEAGAGRQGAYSRVAFLGEGTGTFRPEEGARPAVGSVGAIERVAETRLELLLPRDRRPEVIRTLLATHPYEEPAYDVLPRLQDDGPRGAGRVGQLPEPEPLRAFAERVARALPATAAGVRVGGDPERVIRTVAVCGGAGDGLFPAVRRSGADVYVTADLRHHPASEALAGEEFALVEVAHWASEWPWLADAARAIEQGLGARGSGGADGGGAGASGGTTVEVRVSTICTDPWTGHLTPGAPALPRSSP